MADLTYPGPLIVGTGGRQTNCGGFARVEVRFVEAAEGAARRPFQHRCEIREDRLPADLREAIVRGLNAYSEELSGFEAEIVSAMVHPVDATVAAFEQAGARAAQRFLRTLEGGPRDARRGRGS